MNAPPLRRSSLLLAAALSLLAVGCGAGARPARANSTLASMMMDDDALVYTTPSRRAAVQITYVSTMRWARPCRPPTTMRDAHRRQSA